MFAVIIRVEVIFLKSVQHYLQKNYKMWVLLISIVIAASLVYCFFWDHPFMKGVYLNPYQVDEIQIVRRDGDILQEEIIMIRDKAWIRKILSELKESIFIKEAFPPEYSWLNGGPIYVSANDGRFTKLDAEVHPGHRGEEINEDAMMLVNDRYHYEVPSSLKSFLSMELSEFITQSGSIEIILDNWRPVVVLNGKLHTSYFMGDYWAPKLQFKEIATVKTSLPDHIRYTKPSDINDLLTEGAGTYTAGTLIYEAEGQYFVRNEKESDTWNILLPEGQAAHPLDQDRKGEVLYWESYQSRRYFVVETTRGHEVYSAQDPNMAESCILIWDERDRLFRSPCTSNEYSMEGHPLKQGSLPMERWPSREWGGVLLYNYKD